MIVPLISGKPYFRFRVTLTDRSFVFIIKWSVRFSFFSVDIYEGDEAIVEGRGLHPGVDLLSGLNLNIGTLILDGAVPTVKNLGVANRLVYTSE